MAIDVQEEQVITLRDACDLLPRRRAGKKTAIETLYRWSQRGCRGLRLETVQIGGTRCTSREALQRFFDALTLAARPDASMPTPATRAGSKARRQQLTAADAYCKANGI